MKAHLSMVGLFVVLTLGCATAPPPAPDLFFPESFWSDEENKNARKEERFAKNWEVALSYPEVRQGLKARLLLGPGKGYRMVDGNEVLALSYERPVLIRHTRGGDRNPDGTWAPGCPGSFFQNKFAVYDRIQELRPDVAVVEIHVQENEGCGPAAFRMENWVLKQAQELKHDPASLASFYRFWNIFTYNSETKGWNLAAHSADERRKAIHQAACEGWTWQLGPTTPFVFLYEHGKAVRHNGTYALFVGTPPSAFAGYSAEEATWEDYIKHYFLLPRGGKEREAERERPLSVPEQAAADVLARGILKYLGLL